MVSMKFMVNGWAALLWAEGGVYSLSLLGKGCLAPRCVTPVLLLQRWRDGSAPERGSSGRAAGGDGLSRDSGSRLGRLRVVPG